MGVNIVAKVLMICVCFRYMYAEEYVILDEPDFNIWDADDQNPVLEADRTIYSLCENYHLIINNQKIDCDGIKLIPKIEDGHEIHRRDVAESDLEGSGNGDNPQPEISLYDTSSNKSEVTDVALDNLSVPDIPLTDINVGKSDKDETSISNKTKSESEKVTVTEIPKINNGQSVNISHVTDEDTTKSNETKTENEKPSITKPVEIIKENISINAEETSNTNSTNTEGEPLSVNLRGPITETETELPNLVPMYNETSENESKQPKNVTLTETTTAVPENTENKIKIVATPITEVNATILPTQQPTKDEQEKPIVTNISGETTPAPVKNTTAISTAPKIPEKEEENMDSPSDNKKVDSGKEESTKVPPKVLPSDLAEVETINNHKETETINTEQSGNAVLLKTHKSDGGSSVEGSDSDKALERMTKNENIHISVRTTEQPSMGESAKDVSKASKDTTILVVLFVVVIAIGGAAFTHNFIKKRKQKASSNNELINGIRRSLQNLSSNNGKNGTDVEQGTELKPLMKNSPQISKDYTDTKKEVQA